LKFELDKPNLPVVMRMGTGLP